jgi:hypothetical protein
LTAPLLLLLELKERPSGRGRGSVPISYVLCTTYILGDPIRVVLIWFCNWMCVVHTRAKQRSTSPVPTAPNPQHPQTQRARRTGSAHA